MAPIPGVTHVSESVLQSQNAEIAELRARVENVEAARDDLETTSAERMAAITAKLEDKERQIVEHMNALDDLQTRSEKVNRKHNRLRYEHNDLIKSAGTVEHKNGSLTEINNKLKEDNVRLERELAATREKLEQSSIPEIAEFEKLRAEKEQLKEKAEAQERKINSLTQDFEFTRQQYQNASSAAAELASKNSDLEVEVQSLRRKASEEAAKLRTISNKIEVEQHLAMIDQLQREVEELKDQARAKHRGRGMVTRTGSVAPRSPRIGNSPPPRSRATSRTPASRGGSPVRSIFDRARKSLR